MPSTDSEALTFYLDSEADTLAFGHQLAAVLSAPMVVFLKGDLGAGKTTLTRGMLRGLGHAGNVKSPTYTLVEPYALPDVSLYHFDLYRLGAAEELDYLGLRDYLEQGALIVVEWPERGAGLLPAPDLEVSLRPERAGRRLDVAPGSESGALALTRMAP